MQAAALTSDQRFNAVQAKYKDAVRFSPDAKSAFVYVEGAELNDKKEKLNTFFTKNPESTLIIDFAKDDGFVEGKGVLTFKKNDLPQSVKKLVITNGQQDIIAVGNDFLSGCRGLTSITLNLPALTTVEGNFLSWCEGLISLTLNLPALTTVGDWFLPGCTGLTSLDLSPLSNVTTVGKDFLWGCTGLTSLDLSPLSQITTIENNFLSGCTGLTSLDLSPLSNVTTVGEWFLYGCTNLITIEGMDRVHRTVQAKVVNRLRESNNPLQQQLGAKFYMEYLYAPDPRVEAALKPWNLDVLKGITPKSLADIEAMKGGDVIAAFDEVMARVAASLDAAAVLSYQTHFNPILNYLYFGTGVITWAMYDENKSELQITFKHMAQKLQTLKKDEQASYMQQLLESFAHCQSRQAAHVNAIGAMMGLMPMSSDRSRLRHIYAMINAFKQQQFTLMARPLQNAGNTHAYMRAFTAINGKLGLPVVMQSFGERISKITDDEANNVLAEFLSVFFNPKLLINDMLKAIAEANATEAQKEDPTNPLSVVNVRFEVWATEDKTIKKHYNQNVEAYFKALNHNNAFNIHEDAITPAEIRKLLENMLILKAPKDLIPLPRPVPGLFVGNT